MRRAGLVLLPLLLLVLPACARAGTPAPSPVAAPSTSPAGAAVGVRTITFTDPSRVTDPTPNQPGDETAGRTLVTTVWYPQLPARGPFPVVLLSHGLLGTPTDYQALASRWTAAGFVVVAPAYPLSSRGAAHIQPLDVVNQPADAAFVLTSVLRLSAQAGDRFHGLLDTGRVAAAGHSLGGITTDGLFNTCCRDIRLRAGIVLAGNWIGFSNTYTGPPAPMLFVHGDRDPIVPIVTGQLTYAAVPWPKGFVTLEGQTHIDPYLQPASPAFEVVAATTTDFLRWSLRGDRASLAALRQAAVVPGLAHFEDRLS